MSILATNSAMIDVNNICYVFSKNRCMFVTKCYAFLCVIDLNTDSPNTIHSHLFFVACIIQLCITIKIILTSD